jgi:CheY-like chemotaxis protein/DNA-directed RNA polymerase subunit RPC12/RpoP
MKVEVRCPSCSKSFLVDEVGLGAEFPCPACASTIPVEAPRRSETAPAAVSAKATIPVSSPAPTPTPAAPAGTAVSAAVATPPVPRAVTQPTATEEIVCPRCKLHFVPGRAAVDRAEKERLTVLVVEDLSYFQEIARDALAEEYEVKTAETVAEARAILTGGGVDLLVIDLTLDGGDHGIDLLRSFPVKPCPILIYTAQDESEMYGDSWEELRSLGADDMVIKGMNVGESLVRKVGTLLGKHWDDET